MSDRKGGPKTCAWQKPCMMTAGFLLILATLLYLNAFQVPWQFDDRPNIVDNPTVHLHSLSLDRIGKLMTMSYSGSIRFFSYFTFALNYYFGELDVFGYHLVNLLIHIATGVLIFHFILLTLQLPSLKDKYGEVAFKVALLSSLLFVAHPVQTQSVTYIVQRMSSMSAMFYLLAMVLYVKGRLTTGRFRISCYIRMGLSGLLAMFSKENAFMLPVFIFLYEISFFREPKQRIFGTASTRILAALLGLGVIGILLLGPKYLNVIREGYAYRDFTLSERVLTQFRVVLYYLTLLFFPHPSRLNLDHDFLVSKSLAVPPSTLLSLIGILLLSGIALWKRKEWPAVSFFILWYFGNLAIESSIFPLEMVYEHRLYLPSVGPIFLFSLFLVRGWEKWAPGEGFEREAVFAVLVMALVLPLSWWTVQRNEVWKTEFTLWSDSAKKSPDKGRPHYNLGYYYYTKGQVDKAVEEFELALKLDPRMAPAHYNLGVIAHKRGLLDEAVDRLNKALKINPEYTPAYQYLVEIYGQERKTKESLSVIERGLKRNPQNAKLLNDRGMIFREEGDLERAEQDFKKAITIDPNQVEPRVNLSEIYLRTGRMDQAFEEIRSALKMDPGHGDAHTLLGMIHLQKGRMDEAVSAFLRALKKDPNDVVALTNLGVAYRYKGMVSEAITQFRKVLSIQPNDEEAHLRLGETYLAKGMLDEAMTEGKKVLEINPKSMAGRLILGDTYFKKGSIDQAIFEWKKVLESRPKEARVHHNLAAAYYAKKEFRLAVIHMDKASALGFKIHPQLSELLKPYGSKAP